MKVTKEEFMAPLERDEYWLLGQCRYLNKVNGYGWFSGYSVAEARDILVKALARFWADHVLLTSGADINALVEALKRVDESMRAASTVFTIDVQGHAVKYTARGLALLGRKNEEKM